MSLSDIYRDECESAGVGDEFERLVKKGNTPQFAHMVAMRQPPGTKGTERAFLEGDVIHHGLQGYPEWFRELALKQARKAGISTTGKVFKSGLADDRGPACPFAWVSDPSDVVAACKMQNKSCTGSVEFQNYRPDPTPDCPLSEDLIQESVPEFLTEHPEFRKKPDQLRDAIIEKHGAPAAKKEPKRKKKPGGGPIG